jgi:hypothetical protein
MAKVQRTTHRSTTGRKLYAVRAASGEFKDIQTFERAHRDDIAHHSKAERVAKRKAAAKAALKGTAKKAVKKTAKKTAKKAAKKAAKKR